MTNIEVEVKVSIKLCPLIMAGMAGGRFFTWEQGDLAKGLVCHKAACAVWDDDRECCGLMTYVPKSKEVPTCVS